MTDSVSLVIRIYHCNAQVFDSYRFGSDLIALNNIRSGNSSVNNHSVSTQIGTEPNNGLGITGYCPSYHMTQESDAYRDELDPSVQTKDRIDFSKPMTQLLESVGDLNRNLVSGLNIVAACSDNWRQSMGTQLSTHIIDYPNWRILYLS